jgi:hypothetical protein
MHDSERQGASKMPVLNPSPTIDRNVVVRDPKAIRILAKTLYRDLRTGGFDPKQIVELSSELLGLVTSEIQSAADARTEM